MPFSEAKKIFHNSQIFVASECLQFLTFVHTLSII